LVEGIVADHNRKNVLGTDIPRDQVGTHNIMELLAQKYKTPEFQVYFNNSVVSSFSAKMRTGLGFKFAPGQKVLLSRASTYEKTPGEGKAKGAFDKVTVEGQFGGRRVYEIVTALLKTNAMYYYVLCYQLKNAAGKLVDGLYYQHELTSAAFADRTPRSWEGGADAVRDQAEHAKRVGQQHAKRVLKRR
jgi:hypothetical protein